MSVDLLVLSLGSTHGLSVGDAQLVTMLEDAGARVAATRVRIGAGDRLRRGYPANDLIEATAARRALAAAVARESPAAVIVSTTTASLLTDGLIGGRTGRPFGIWLDSPARLNRPGAQNAVLWRLERRRMAHAAVVMPWSAQAVPALPDTVRRAVVISPPIHLGPSLPVVGAPPEREGLVVAYAPDPKAKDLELVVRAWAAYVEQAGDPRSPAAAGARLVLTGIEPGWAREFLRRRGVRELPPRLELAGMVDRGTFLGLLERASVFLSGARWEDFGQAPLEALAAGALLVAAPAGGPFPALELARELAPACVSAYRSPVAVARALEVGLGLDPADRAQYASAARAALAPYARAATVTRLSADVLPFLLG